MSSSGSDSSSDQEVKTPKAKRLMDDSSSDSDTQIKDKNRKRAKADSDSSHSRSKSRSPPPPPPPKQQKQSGHSSSGRKKGKDKKVREKPKIKINIIEKKKKKPVQVEEEDEYQVEKIIEKKYDEEEGIYKYFIKWIGWPSSTNTWEPLENLTGCVEILKEFEANWAKDRSVTKEKESGSSEKHRERKKSESRSRDVIKPSTPSRAVYQTPPTPPREELIPLDFLPGDKTLKSLVGVIELKGVLTYIVEWECEFGDQDVGMLTSKVMTTNYPSVVIEFFERRIRWTPTQKITHFKKDLSSWNPKGTEKEMVPTSSDKAAQQSNASNNNINRGHSSSHKYTSEVKKPVLEKHVAKKSTSKPYRI